MAIRFNLPVVWARRPHRYLRHIAWCGALGLLITLLSATSAYAAASPSVGQVTWPPVNLRLLEDGFARPLGIVSPNDGTDRLFVVEKRGTIYIIENGTRLETPFLDISSRIAITGCNECGLLGLAFPPNFAEAGYFFVNYTSLDDRIGPDTGDPDPNDMGDTVIARYHVTGDPNVADSSVEEPILIINQPATNHNGGQILFGPDGYLYIATGDGGGTGDPHANAQDPASLLGKLLRIEVGETMTYTIPATNPFTTTAGYRDEIWMLGLRNPWRFHFDRVSGDLYIADVGQGNFEEVNYIAAADLVSGTVSGGLNFGWNILEGESCYPPNGPQDCDRTGLIAPVTTYDHSAGDCSVTGGYVYRSPDPNQAPVYLYADYCTGRLWGLQPDGDNWVTTELDDLPFRVSSFGVDTAGNIYVANYDDGEIYVVDEPITGLSAANDGPTTLGSPTAFTASIDGGSVMTYTWDFGDGTSGSGITTTHTYAAVGIFTATVVASNATSNVTATTTVYVGNAVVEVVDFDYLPRNITVPVGSTVVWVLRQGNHSVTADDGSFDQPAGTEWSPFLVNFETEGLYPYYCTLHGGPGGDGMSGSVQVVNRPEADTDLYIPGIFVNH